MDWPECDRLRPPAELRVDGDLARRRARLRRLVDARAPRGGYLVEPARGRTPTDSERDELSRVGAAGRPKGLERCESCGGHRGVALLTGVGLVVDVYCVCDNHNRCAWCLEPLADRRLDACGYFEEGNAVLHVPAFVALEHRCGLAMRPRRPLGRAA